MRLLRHCDNGDVGLTKDFADSEAMPSYAILSHTWGADNEEVTFDDLRNGTGKQKPGFEKIRFCGEQAMHDGLHYFWIDTCCINKANKAELSHAISSMFRWYRNASRCYVYLSDVPATPATSQPIEQKQYMPMKASSEAHDSLQWESDLRKSKWFTRGWTLQELLGPVSVEFFSQDRGRLGDKRSLEQLIHETTGIPEAALQGRPLCQFSVKDRFRWIESRQTKLEEDRAYSLLGIFDMNIPLRYGEGMANAFKRLEEEIDKVSKCIQDVRSTDPRDDKKRIEDTKGGLLGDSYYWILGNSDFQRWRDTDHARLLWIKGDPGKGKTMLLCGIINELNKSMRKTDLLSYFFCQATDSRINSATAVLRGLLYMLVNQQPSLVSHVQKRYDHAGKALFEDANAWMALSEIFANILQDPSLSTVYLIVDALDECVLDLPRLLGLVVQHSSTSSRIKWIVSSRNWPVIEEHLAKGGYGARLSLEMNAESVSGAVDVFIKHKVLQLAQKKKYDGKMKQAVQHHLSTNAHDTFLWVALVCQGLEEIPRWRALTALDTFPPGLASLYRQMINQISSSGDADLCKRVLASIAIAYRPITIREMTSFVEMPEDIADNIELLHEIVGLCGSFLTFREGTIYLIHQSAKDFLLTQAYSEIFPFGSEGAHHDIFTSSLKILSRTLRRDMYNLGAVGYLAEDIEQPDPDPLAMSRYLCTYWIDHLCDCNPNSSAKQSVDLQDGGIVDMFLRKKYLYWLEALSLCKSLSKGMVSIAKLEALTQSNPKIHTLFELIQDARRFMMYYKSAIENAPLQAYVSALVFSPKRSLIRKLFEEELPGWLTVQPAIPDKWNACLQTLEGHNDLVSSVAFSYNSILLASGSCDKTVKLWDASSGACLRTLKGHSKSVRLVAFSHDSAQLASASDDGTVKIWDTRSGACLLTLKGHRTYVWSVTFSHDSIWLASASWDNTVKIWDTSSGACLRKLEGHNNSVSSVAFSYNSVLLASGSWDKTVKLWDASSGTCLRTLEGHSNPVNSVTFSHDSTQLASASQDGTVKIWDEHSGICLQTFGGHSGQVYSVAFSHNSTWLASALYNHTVKIWDARSGACLQTLEGHSRPVSFVTFSHDSIRLASASWDCTIKVWDTRSDACQPMLDRHSDPVRLVVFSSDSIWIASAPLEGPIKIWDTGSGACLQTLEGHSRLITSMAFSHDSTQLVSASWDCTLKIWDTSSGVCLQILEGSCLVDLVTFSRDSIRIVSASLDGSINIWDISSGECLQTFEAHSDSVTSLAFSHDSAWLASASEDSTIRIWDASSGKCLQTLNTGTIVRNISFDISDSYLHTDIGTMDISFLLGLLTFSTISEPQGPIYRGLAVSSDCLWLTHNSKNLVWLPSEYRPGCSAVLGNSICIGLGNGTVWICKVEPGAS